jgi:hypothetical protein
LSFSGAIVIPSDTPSQKIYPVTARTDLHVLKLKFAPTEGMIYFPGVWGEVAFLNGDEILAVSSIEITDQQEVRIIKGKSVQNKVALIPSNRN